MKGWFKNTFSKNIGDHDLFNLRIDKGHHLHMDSGIDGVWLHKDYINLNISLLHVALLGLFEVAPLKSTEIYMDRNFGNGNE